MSRHFYYLRENIDITKINGYKIDLEIYGYIYVTEFPNGKVYVGQSIFPINSFDEKSYFGSGVKYKRAECKYGKHNLKKKILRLCYTLIEYNKWENVYIKSYKADNPKFGYNILPGSANDWNGGLNPAHLPEVKKKISEAHKGRKDSKEVIEKRKISARKTLMFIKNDPELNKKHIANLKRGEEHYTKGGLKKRNKR